MAPILGVTDSIFRTTFAKHFEGFDLAVSPFLRTKQGGRYKNNKFLDLHPERNQTLPIHPQILTNNAEDFVSAAKALFDQGHEIINLNLGCPVPTATKKGKGAGFLPHPEKIDKFLDAVLSEIPNRLSIKTRTGLESPEELIKLIPVFNRYPLVEIIIHPRTAPMMYAGDIDYDTFEKCIDGIKHDIVYNGEINTLEDFTQLSDKYKSVKKWMIGKGALENPLLPGQIKGNTYKDEEKLSNIRKFHDELFEKYGETESGNHLLMRMKTIFQYLSFSFDDSRKSYKKIKKCSKLAKYNAVVDELFNN